MRVTAVFARMAVVEEPSGDDVAVVLVVGRAADGRSWAGSWPTHFPLIYPAVRVGGWGRRVQPVFFAGDDYTAVLYGIVGGLLGLTLAMSLIAAGVLWSIPPRRFSAALTDGLVANGMALFATLAAVLLPLPLPVKKLYPVVWLLAEFGALEARVAMRRESHLPPVVATIASALPLLIAIRWLR